MKARSDIANPAPDTVKKQTSANYIQMVYVGNNKLVNLMNQEMNRDEDILRHFTTKLVEMPEM